MTTPGPHPVDRHVGRLIRLRRKELGVSQVRLAQAVGLTFQQVQKYENAANRISASKLYDIATFLSSPVESFYAGLPPPGEAGAGGISTAVLALAALPEAADLAAPLALMTVSQRKLLVAVARAIASNVPAAK